jgi:chemotaxis protein CheZ
MNPDVDLEFRECLDGLQDDTRMPVSSGDIRRILEEILGSLKGDLSVPGAERISEAQTALASVHGDLSPVELDELRYKNFPDIKSDLEALMQSLSTSAEAILAATEKIEDAIDKAEPEDAETASTALAEIYQACSFQDINGQRVARVNQTVKRIEYTTEILLAALGDDTAKKRKAELGDFVKRAADRNAERLLHGPQDGEDSNTQEDIDKILASFD